MRGFDDYLDSYGNPGMGDNPGTKVYTVIGLWNDGVPLAAGAIEGVHAVDGDLDYIGFQPWATSVEADDPDEAMETAVERMQGERDAEDDE